MKNYMILKCIKCGKEIIVPKCYMDIDDNMRCAFSNCKGETLQVSNSFASIRDCMNHAAYTREKGKIRQEVHV